MSNLNRSIMNNRIDVRVNKTKTHPMKKRAQAQMESLLNSTRFQGRINTYAAQTSSETMKGREGSIQLLPRYQTHTERQKNSQENT